MELNNKNSDGQKWEFCRCVHCKYSDGKFCKYYKGDKIDLPIDLCKCPGFEKEEKPINMETIDK